MILDPSGRPTRHKTETAFAPRLVETLSTLEDLLHQNGLALVCMKCSRLGLNDGVQIIARPESDVIRAVCGCAVRTFHRKTGRETVQVN